MVVQLDMCERFPGDQTPAAATSKRPSPREGDPMQPIRRTAAVLLILAGLTLVSLPGSAPALAAQPAAATWTLVDYQQRTCYVSARGGTNYYGIWISGKWSHKINIGASALPAGAAQWNSYAPIPPGSSDGVYSLAYVAVQLPPGTPVGTVTSTLWANDGTTTETVPITLVVNASSCRRY